MRSGCLVGSGPFRVVGQSESRRAADSAAGEPHRSRPTARERGEGETDSGAEQEAVTRPPHCHNLQSKFLDFFHVYHVALFGVRCHMGAAPLLAPPIPTRVESGQHPPQSRPNRTPNWSRPIRRRTLIIRDGFRPGQRRDSRLRAQPSSFGLHSTNSRVGPTRRGRLGRSAFTPLGVRHVPKLPPLAERA